jgi:hypothetical protein
MQAIATVHPKIHRSSFIVLRSQQSLTQSARSIIRSEVPDADVNLLVWK